ncbi:NADPH-dependent 2,4-dienoyl-CoA reductase/sulfur reductase-like enzyme/nitrite reductase/ring-hydroxylating ferredoxin subunit [Spirosoma lacussanchae]|uniref:FAD-dependent oxidoreductase n=1 Tax=Spirosoma lacussanchae TaxID=1884249 RepID=UPI00110A01FF|nr:FAD-dependent oxidoreductase [Spirosoma lacussanchae]
MTTNYAEAAVCRVDDLADGDMREVQVGDKAVLLARVNGEYHALHPQCTHYQAPLAKGLLHGNRLVCPWHNACFDVRTGHRLEAPALNGLPKHAVRIENGQVIVQLTTDSESVENPMAEPDPASTDTCVIVGSGGAGAFAAEGLREGGFTGRIVMLTASEEAPYDRPNCSKDYLQGEAPDEWMPLRTDEFYQTHHIEIRTGQRVVSLDPSTKTIELASGETLTYQQAVLAPGGSPNPLPVPGAGLAGVYTLRSLHDSQLLRDAGQPGKRVVVIGSSFIGLEAAMSLRKLGCEVDVVGRDTIPFQKILGPAIGRVIQGWHEEAGIRFHLGTEVEQLTGDTTVREVVLKSGESLAADIVLVGLGVKPQTAFVRGVDRQDDGGIRTDEYLRIAPDLYAAGDVAVYPIGDGAQRIEHWKVAGQQGYVAGLNMAGQQQAYQQVPFFWTNQHGKRINYIGHADSFDDIIYDGDPEKDDAFLAFYVAGDQILAVAGLKRDVDIAIIRELMQLGRLPSVASVRAGVNWTSELKKA